MLVLIVMVFVTLFDVKKGATKLALSLISLAIVALHYYTLFLLMAEFDVQVLPLPLVLVTSTARGSSMMIDFGQVLVIMLVILWRKDIVDFMRKVWKKEDASERSIDR
ncbi:MAG: hypothetical protein ABWK00_03185 [Desulfurococcaceae archaeon]